MGVFLYPFNLDLFPRLPYNVGMKDKELKIKVDDQFIEKVEYLQLINGYKNRSDTIRRTLEKDFCKEVYICRCCLCYEDKRCIVMDSDVEGVTRDARCPLPKGRKK